MIAAAEVREKMIERAGSDGHLRHIRRTSVRRCSLLPDSSSSSAHSIISSIGVSRAKMSPTASHNRSPKGTIADLGRIRNSHYQEAESKEEKASTTSRFTCKYGLRKQQHCAPDDRHPKSNPKSNQDQHRHRVFRIFKLQSKFSTEVKTIPQHGVKNSNCPSISLLRLYWKTTHSFQPHPFLVFRIIHSSP